MALTMTKVWFSHDEQCAARSGPEAELIATLALVNPWAATTITGLSTYFSVVHGVTLIEETSAGGSEPGLYHVGMSSTNPSTGNFVVYVEDTAVSGVSAEAGAIDLSTVTAMKVKFKGVVASNYGA